ncbi:efflux RND transporter periplasmic adaptor subunit [Variovorax sp. UMC13]|uniref:efflux RND transporter periplasmic adaptor subunit n=1 Tax=Variovorax sp. UMC13 TaxID=1862326 RepID=UPI0016020D00|nr:HlyD family efflux transporter periplasmic adaptor subunit [Variovorax sp. UMC13]MBB1602604.1 secretion protein HlyD [Variovorax sp. UMC13]
MKSSLSRYALPASMLALALAIAGCSDHGSTSVAAAAPAPGPRDVAMARGKVEVQGGLLDLLPQQDGVVESVGVREGDEVKRGQVLLKLASDQARLDVDMAQAELKLVQARQRAQSARLPAARQLALRTGEAAKAGALDPQRADEALQARSDIESAVAVLEAEAAVARQKLAQAERAVQRQTLTAPIDARVLRLQVQTGSRVSSQSTRPALVLLPHRPLTVRAELSEAYVANVKPGMRASVRLDGDTQGAAAQAAYPARVLRVSQAYGTSRLDDDATARNVRVVECFLEFDPPVPVLRLGQNVRVSFHE